MNPNQPVQAPQSVTVTAPEVMPIQSNATPQGNNRKLLLIVIIVLIVLTITAGGLIYLRNSNLFKASAPIQAVVNSFEDLKSELESTDIGASEGDLSEFDKELNSL